MDYAEIKAREPRVLRSNEENGCSCSDSPEMVNVQRLSPYGRVKPQAYGGRKIQPLRNKGDQIIYSHVKA